MTLSVKNYIEGDTAVSYDDGKRCYTDILKILDNGENVTLDFEGIDYVITAFLNPIIGDLILQKGINIMKSINIINVNQKTIGKIKMVKDGALLKREDME
uniref:STAS-like domain-containing protein n=1 Tax=Roseburia sp. TaxID=2049040 RepID=UPI003FEF1D7A